MDLLTCTLILLVIVLIFVIYYKLKPKLNNVFKRYIYLDANGTTPICPGALAEYNRCAYMGNPSAGYSKDVGSDGIIDEASAKIKQWLSIPVAQGATVGEVCGYKVVFNSCASEGNNYVLRCVSDAYLLKHPGELPHFVISSLEHKTTIECAKKLEKLGRATISFVGPTGSARTIGVGDIEAAVTKNTVLISVMHANNETGNLNDIEGIGKLAQERGILFHSDVVQTIGKFKIDMLGIGLDALTMSMHKIYGPVGVGAIVMSPRLLSFLGECAQQIAGTQFDGLRGGTINIAGIAASSKALEVVTSDRSTKNERLDEMRQMTTSALAELMPIEDYSKFYGHGDKYTGEDLGTGLRLVSITGDKSLPNTLLLSIVRLGKYNIDDENQRFCNVKLKKALFARGIVVSIGSACNTKEHGPSHVLRAIGAPFLIRAGTIRISMLDSTSSGDIKKLISAMQESINEQIKGFK
jgi:cysteine desulfurase